MENNFQNQGITPESSLPPQPSLPKENDSGKKILLLLGFLGIVILLGIGYIFYSKTPKTYNATVYNQPTTVTSVSPSPSVYQSNPKDTSDQAINQDTNATSTDLNSLDSSLSSVDQSLNDQQTNLQ